jgi:hypothetical protein
LTSAWNAESFNYALTSGPEITGGVIYFGHGGADPRTGEGALFVGHGPRDNLLPGNVSLLSGSKLGLNATIELNACYSGAGGANSIAAHLARQLKRPVVGWTADMGFSPKPSQFIGGEGVIHPDTGPTYMVVNPTGQKATYQP